VSGDHDLRLTDSGAIITGSVKKVGRTAQTESIFEK